MNRRKIFTRQRGYQAPLASSFSQLASRVGSYYDLDKASYQHFTDTNGRGAGFKNNGTSTILVEEFSTGASAYLINAVGMAFTSGNNWTLSGAGEHKVEIDFAFPEKYFLTLNLNISSVDAANLKVYVSTTNDPLSGTNFLQLNQSVVGNLMSVSLRFVYEPGDVITFGFTDNTTDYTFASTSVVTIGTMSIVRFNADYYYQPAGGVMAFNGNNFILDGTNSLKLGKQGQAFDLTKLAVAFVGNSSQGSNDGTYNDFILLAEDEVTDAYYQLSLLNKIYYHTGAIQKRENFKGVLPDTNLVFVTNSKVNNSIKSNHPIRYGLIDSADDGFEIDSNLSQFNIKLSSDFDFELTSIIIYDPDVTIVGRTLQDYVYHSMRNIYTITDRVYAIRNYPDIFTNSHTLVQATVGGTIEVGETNGKNQLLVENPFNNTLIPNGISDRVFKSADDYVRSVVGGAGLGGNQVIQCYNNGNNCRFNFMKLTGGTAGITWPPYDTAVRNSTVQIEDVVIVDCSASGTQFTQSIAGRDIYSLTAKWLRVKGVTSNGEEGFYSGNTGTTLNSRILNSVYKHMLADTRGREGGQFQGHSTLLIENQTYYDVGKAGTAGHNRAIQIQNNGPTVVRNCVFYGAPAICQLFGWDIHFINCQFHANANDQAYIGKYSASFPATPFNVKRAITFEDCYFSSSGTLGYWILVDEDEVDIEFINCFKHNLSWPFWSDNRVDKVTYDLTETGTTLHAIEVPTFNSRDIDFDDSHLLTSQFHIDRLMGYGFIDG